MMKDFRETRTPERCEDDDGALLLRTDTSYFTPVGIRTGTLPICANDVLSKYVSLRVSTASRELVKGLHSFLAVSVLLSGFIATETFAKAPEKSKHLSAKEVRTLVVGKVISDGTHWKYHLKPNGTIDALELGHRRSGRWHFKEDRLCIEINYGSAPPGCWYVVQDRKGLTLNDSAGPVYSLEITGAPLRR